MTSDSSQGRILVIHTIANLGASVGGPSKTVPALCRHAMGSDSSVTCEIVTTHDGPFGANVDTPGVTMHSVAHREGAAAFRRLLASRLDVARGDENLSGVILHDHGQWLPSNRIAAAMAAAYALPRIVSPRGMLTPWAMRHRYWKKKAAWLLFARRDFLITDVLHATSPEEAKEFRALGARQPVALVPNGVEWRDKAPRPKGTGKERIVVFLSRIHVKKGVRELVDAWRAVQPAGWRLVLAGPDEGRLIPSLGLSAADAIDYRGEVQGEEKWRLLETAEVVVLPSHSENFGVVVAEALMAGTPVIATQGTPWSGLDTHHCGWWIELTPVALQRALRAATALDAGTLEAMGRNGRDWVTEAFSWPAIGRRMAEVYGWLVRGGPRPAALKP